MKGFSNNNLIKILNIIKIISLIAILVVFFYQQVTITTVQQLNITRILLFTFAGIGISCIISTTLLKRDKLLKPFLIILGILFIIFILLIFNIEKLIIDDMKMESKIILYILIGVSSITLISVYLIKRYVIKENNQNSDSNMMVDDYIEGNQ